MPGASDTATAQEGGADVASAPATPKHDNGPQETNTAVQALGLRMGLDPRPAC